MEEFVPKIININECNYQNFNERKFNESLTNMKWELIILIDESDPNILMNTHTLLPTSAVIRTMCFLTTNF